MTWRSRSLRVLPIAFPLLLPPDGTWARGRGHAHGHHHDHHHPLTITSSGSVHPCGYAPCGCGWSVGCGHTLAPGSPQSSAKKTPAARGPPEAADRGEQIRGEIDAPVDGGLKCAGSWGALMRPSQLNALMAA